MPVCSIFSERQRHWKIQTLTTLKVASPTRMPSLEIMPNSQAATPATTRYNSSSNTNFPTTTITILQTTFTTSNNSRRNFLTIRATTVTIILTIPTALATIMLTTQIITTVLTTAVTTPAKATSTTTV
jgi:hypothetical protein